MALSHCAYGLCHAHRSGIQPKYLHRAFCILFHV